MKRIALLSMLVVLFFSVLNSVSASQSTNSQNYAAWSKMTYFCTQSSGQYHLIIQHADLVYYTPAGGNLQTAETDTIDSASGHSASTFDIPYASHGQTVDTYDYYYHPINSASLPITLQVDVKSLDQHGIAVYETTFVAHCNRTLSLPLNATISSHNLPFLIQAAVNSSIGIVHP